MASTRGRGAWSHVDQEADPVFSLFIGVVRQAQKDLSLPINTKNSSRPSEYERQTAVEFLEALRESALRRSDV